MVKNLIAIAIGLSILFTGCDQDSKEANAYDIEKALDEGNYEKVLSELGDCSQYSGQKKKDCYLNVGAAYFGKANFDLISMAQEISKIDDDLDSDAKSKEFNKIVFDKLDDENLKKGLDKYKIVVDGNDSICNNKNYDSLTLQEKSACIAINPLLLSELLDEDDDANKSENSVSLAQIIEFKDVLKDAVPELVAEDMISIISGDELGTKDDRNNNNVLDKVEATQYVLKSLQNNTWTTDDNISKDSNNSNIYGETTNLTSVNYYKIKISGTTGINYFHRLTQEISNTGNFTTLTTEVDKVCDNTNTYTTGTINGTTILPCVKLKDSGQVTSLNDSVVNVLNNDNLLNSIALSSESEDDSKTDNDKIKEFKNNICDVNGTASNTNNGLCDFNTTTGKLIITQDALLDYMNETK